MIAILGGTFDPIHLGHLAIAEHAKSSLNAEQVLFLPCKKPVHKTASSTDTQHRLNMLKLAIESNSTFDIDESEIRRTSPSYTLETLEHLAQRYLNKPLFFLIGMDSLNTFHTWYKWQTCMTQANFLVFKRPGEQFNPAAEISPFIAGDIAHYFKNPSNSGSIYLVEHQQVAISSSDLRQNIIQLGDKFLPQSVARYIKQHRLYQ